MTHVPAKRRSAGRSVLIVVLILAAVGLGVFGFVTLFAGSAADADTPAGGEWYTVERRNLPLTLTATGELEAQERVEVKSRVNGRPQIVWVIDEGVQVERGDELVRLDSDEIEESLEQEQLNVESARAEKIAAEQNFEIEKNEAQSKQRTAEVDLELAQLELKQWREGTVPTKRRELELALEKARVNLERTTKDLESSEELYAEKFISENDLLDARIARREAEDALETAKLNIEVYEQYTHRKEEQEKLSKVEKAEDELERVVRQNEINLTRVEADLNSKTRRLKIREDRLAELQEQLENCVITAPQDGLVIYGTSVGGRWNRRDPIQEGREVRFNETVIILPDTSRMAVNLMVHEAMLSQVDTGQRVAVTIDALPDRSFAGEVASVAVTAEDGGWMNPNLREYKVRADLPGELDVELKPAMRATGEILLGRVDNALVVPLQAVFAREDDRFVYVGVGGGRVERRSIETGKSSDTFVEVTAGLDPGDRVLLREPEPQRVVNRNA